MGFEVKGVENGLLQLYLEGSRVAKVDESGSMLYRPNPNVFKLMDEIEAWRTEKKTCICRTDFKCNTGREGPAYEIIKRILGVL